MTAPRARLARLSLLHAVLLSVVQPVPAPLRRRRGPQRRRQAPARRPRWVPLSPGCAIAYDSVNTNGVSTTTDATSFSSGSWTPTDGTICIAFVTNTKATTPDLGTVSGNSLTWTQIDTVTVNSTVRTTCYWAYVTGATAGVTTVDFAGITQTGCAMKLRCFSGCDTATPIVQHTTNSANTGSNSTTLVITLASSVTAGNATIGYFAKNATAAFTVGSGFTSAGTTNYATPGTVDQAEYNLSPSGTAVDVTYASAIVAICGVAFELKAAGTIKIPLFRNLARQMGNSL